jgi:hypothetical protein
MWSIVQSHRIGNELDRYYRKPQTQIDHEPSIEHDLPRISPAPTSSASDESVDQFLVECTSENDPMNPQNRPLIFRAKTMAILCLLVFVQAWAGASGLTISLTLAPFTANVALLDSLAKNRHTIWLPKVPLSVVPKTKQR